MFIRIVNDMICYDNFQHTVTSFNSNTYFNLHLQDVFM